MPFAYVNYPLSTLTARYAAISAERDDFLARAIWMLWDWTGSLPTSVFW